MVKQLLDMLKKHASDEVGSGLQHPEGEGDMHGIQAERVEVLPEHEMDHSTPEHDVVTHEMHDGGVVEKVNEGGYPAAPDKKIPYESADGHPDKEGSAHEEASESDDERESEGDITPMFESFFGKRKKK